MKRAIRNIKLFFLHADLYLLFSALSLSIFGIILIYSATRSYDTNKYIYIQIVATIIGIAAFVITSFIDIDYISGIWKWLFIFNLALLASLAIWGYGEGNRSWINLGIVSVQPAEIGKLVMIFTLAQHIYQRREELNSPPVLLLLLLHAGITTAFVYIFSEDLGMALNFLFIAIIMFFAAGVLLRWFAAALVTVSGLFPIIWSNLKPYHKTRILVVFDPTLDPDKAYHAEQSKIALGAGQLTGRGFLQGRQTQYGLLPTKHTDFIFSVAGEEFGFIGCLFIVLLLSFIIFKIFYNSSKAQSQFSSLVCVGLGSMLLFQTFINIGMCTGLTPVIGLTLPLISYGGSSVVTTYTALGIVSGVRMREKPSWLK